MLLCAADQLKNMQVSIDQMKQISDKAKSTWDKFRKERDFHKMHHKRVVQVAGQRGAPSAPLSAPTLCSLSLLSGPSLTRTARRRTSWWWTSSGLRITMPTTSRCSR